VGSRLPSRFLHRREKRKKNSPSQYMTFLPTEWFSSWFDSGPKRKVRRRSTTSTSTTSTTTTTHTPSAAQVPILTIVDPLRNPQNWIGILAHHIVNSTGNAISTTTSNPLLQALATRMTTRGTTSTTTTTSRPEAPRRISYDKYQIWRLKPQIPDFKGRGHRPSAKVTNNKPKKRSRQKIMKTQKISYLIAECVESERSEESAVD